MIHSEYYKITIDEALKAMYEALDETWQTKGTLRRKYKELSGSKWNKDDRYYNTAGHVTNLLVSLHLQGKCEIQHTITDFTIRYKYKKV